MPDISIVIPAYNEEKLIEDTLQKVLVELKNLRRSFELIVVDDGSSDNTSKIVKTVKGVRLITLSKNVGKGGALREGMLEAKGKYVIFMDADLSVPLSFIRPMISKLKKSDVVIGTRRVTNSKIVVHQPLIRESLGRVFTKLTQVMTNTKLSDYTCGFKGFSYEAAQKVFSNALINRWAYDSEIMFLANKYGFKIREMPVEWYNRAESKVNLKNAIITSLRDLFVIRINNLKGRYAK